MTETARMETTFARPSASGAKHNGIIVGLSKPASATPIASDIISTVVTIKTLRKLRTPNFSNTLSAPGGPSDRSEDWPHWRIASEGPRCQGRWTMGHRRGRIDQRRPSRGMTRIDINGRTELRSIGSSDI